MEPERTLHICRVVRAIPRGCVCSYGEIASRAGYPGRARLVGRILRETDEQPPLPWHRVLRADGSLAFPAESEQAGRQAELLAAEGVPVIRNRVDLKRFGWQQDLDRELWGPG
ncbi:MAG: MGMT family protein [Xanthomonadales bacterium]|nr:MGMT family protein [Xanthomonadales bacterium]